MRPYIIRYRSHGDEMVLTDQPYDTAVTELAGVLQLEAVELEFEVGDLPKNKLLNFFAVVAKSVNHLVYLLGYKPSALPPANLFWVSGKNFSNGGLVQFIATELQRPNYVGAFSFDDGKFKLRFTDLPPDAVLKAKIVVAMCVRMHNLAIFCLSHNKRFNTEKPMTWATFHAITCYRQRELSQTGSVEDHASQTSQTNVAA